MQLSESTVSAGVDEYKVSPVASFDSCSVGMTSTPPSIVETVVRQADRPANVHRSHSPQHDMAIKPLPPFLGIVPLETQPEERSQEVSEEQSPTPQQEQVRDQEQKSESRSQAQQQASEVDAAPVTIDGGLEITSERLRALVQKHPTLNTTLGVIVDTLDLCQAAAPVATNATEMSRVIVSLGRMLEATADEPMAHDRLFRALTSVVKEVYAGVEPFTTPGWLQHLLFMDNLQAHFEAMYTAVEDTVVANAPPRIAAIVKSVQPRFVDPARPVARVFKQLGEGSVTDGLYTAAGDSVYDQDVVHALKTTPSMLNVSIDKTAVRRELRALPPRTRQTDLRREYQTGVGSSLGEVRSRLGPEAASMLRDVFLEFAAYGRREEVHGMDGAHFMKLARDSGLVGRGQGRVSSSDVDIIFAKVRKHGERLLTFQRFVVGLDELSQRASRPLQDVVNQVLQSKGPVTHATTTETVRFYDDKTTYTGTWAHGGGPPTICDAPKDLATQLSRNINPGARRNVAAAARRASGNSHSSSHSGQRALADKPTVTVHINTKPKNGKQKQDPARDLHEVFTAYSTFGKGAAAALVATRDPDSVVMDSKGFAKLAKECGMIGGKLDTTRVDLCFTKYCNKVTKRLGYYEFGQALEECAKFRECSVEEALDLVLHCKGPIVRGTKAKHVRLHDDASLHTGTFSLKVPSAKQHPRNADGRPAWVEK